MPQLIFFRQTDELATPLSVEEQSDAWWAGVQRCFAAVPIAAAAAVALSASLAFGAQQQTDDIVPQPQAALDDGYYEVVVPPPPPPKLLYLPDPEEIPAGSLRATAEEDYWWSPPVRLVASSPQPWAIEDDLSPVIDDPYWWSPSWIISATAPQPWTADDDLPVAPAAAALDDGGWLQSVVVSTPPALPPLTWDDQAVPAAPVAAPPEEDLWQVTTPGPLPPRFLYLPDPEALPGALAGTVDEDAWSQPWSIRATALGQLWTVPDELPSTPTTPVETDPWSPALVVQPPTSMALWTIQDEIIAPLRVDEVYDWRAYSLPAPIVASAWLLEIDGFPPPLFIHVDVVRLLQIAGHNAALEEIQSVSAGLIDPKGSA